MWVLGGGEGGGRECEVARVAREVVFAEHFCFKSFRIAGGKPHSHGARETGVIKAVPEKHWVWRALAILTMVGTARRAVSGGFGETALPECSSPLVPDFRRLVMIEVFPGFRISPLFRCALDRLGARVFLGGSFLVIPVVSHP